MLVGDDRFANLQHLTEREREVLQWLLRGKTNKEIAGHLGCSVKTVQFHVGNVLKKTGSASRLVLLANLLTSHL